LDTLLKSIVAIPLLVLMLCAPTILTACDKANHSPVIQKTFTPPIIDPVLLEAHKDVVDPAPPVVDPEVYVDKAPVVVVNPAVKVDKVRSSGAAEAAAYAKAKDNAARALCLKLNVDHKIDRDIQFGRIRDVGNILGWAGCKAPNLTPFYR